MIKMAKSIIIAALPCSGKSTFAQKAEELGIHAYALGDIIRETAKERGLELTNENLRKISLWYNDGREDLLIEKFYHKIPKDENIVLIDGVRTITQTKNLKKYFDIVIVAIHAKDKGFSKS
jgi:adenylate kinase